MKVVIKFTGLRKYYMQLVFPDIHIHTYLHIFTGDDFRLEACNENSGSILPDVDDEGSGYKDDEDY